MNQTFRKTALLVGACAVLGLAYTPQAYAQQITRTSQSTKKVTGTIVDDMGPLMGATVQVKGTGTGAVTDANGNFSLNVPQGATLVVSYVGFKSQEIKVGNQSIINVNMQEDNALEEVVVVGYGVQKKKLFTGANISVKGEDVSKMNTTNALTALQSQAPGVNIAQSSAQPGKGFKVNIRGVGTIGESSPLLVIDGIVSGTADNGLNGLNPNDIESIDVLKDAASAAIYGARAANGVILVTTKQGKEGRITVQYDGYVGVSNAYKVPGLVTAQQYMQLINETNFNTYGTATDWPSLVPQSILDKVNNGWKGTDWFKEYENKNALQFSHAATIYGGSERSKFSMSVNYSRNEGIMGADNASYYQRYGGRINSEHILLKGKTHNIITVGENLSYWYHRSHDLAEGNGYWNIMQAAYAASPLVEPYNADGSLAAYTKNSGYSDMIYANPLNGFLNGRFNSINKNRDFGVGGTFYWIIEPVKNLKYRGQFNAGYSASNSRNVQLPHSESSTNSSDGYNLGMQQDQSSSFSIDNTLSYAFPTFAKNNIDVLIGQSIERSNWSTGMSMNFAVPSDNVNTMVQKGWDYNIPTNYEAKFLQGHTGYDNPTRGTIASFFGRLNWNYDEKYMITAIFRRDGSNNFARGHRWGNFPSVSAGWVITNEKFMEGASSWLDFLKIRGSWGQNGNCVIPPFSYLSNIGYSPSGYADYGYKFSSDNIYTVGRNNYTTGAYAKNAPNPDVTWETSEQLDFGFDARFFGGKLTVAFDWYKKTTKDWLVQAPMNEVLGYEEPAVINGGDIKNTGIEIGLGWRQRVNKNFNYFANVNFTKNKNEVIRLGAQGGKIGNDKKYDSSLFQNSSYVSLVEVSHPIGHFYGMSYSGIWQSQAQIDAARAAGQAVLDDAQPGDPIWDDFDKDGTINYDNDRHDIGNPHPDFTLGVNLGFEYKGLDFSVTGYGAFGQQIMQSYRTALLANPYNNYTVDAFDRWHGEGTSNTQPRLTVGAKADQWVSTRYMQDADYFRIQNITLGYDFTKIWKNDLFEQLRLYVQAQNLYTFTKYTGVDPECTSDGGKSQDNQNFIRGIDVGLYPSARTFLVGLSVKFSDKRDHKTAGPAPVIIRDNDEINRLNSEIEQLRAENNRLKNAPTPAKEKEVITKKEVITFPYLVNFDINKTVVVNRERVNIGNVATMIKAAEGKKFAITGYADQQTGNPEINAKLAQQRAQAVYDVLTKECGIPASRLVLDSKGGVDYMYFKDAEMSRSVIISEVK